MTQFSYIAAYFDSRRDIGCEPLSFKAEEDDAEDAQYEESLPATPRCSHLACDARGKRECKRCTRRYCIDHGMNGLCFVCREDYTDLTAEQVALIKSIEAERLGTKEIAA